MQKSSITFPVVGTQYLGGALEYCSSVGKGSVLSLIPEDDNNGAVAVYHSGRKIGYTPDRGYSCSLCKVHVPADTKTCPECKGQVHVVKGGMATRLRLIDIWSVGFACFVSELSPDSKFPVTATLVLDAIVPGA